MPQRRARVPQLRPDTAKNNNNNNKQTHTEGHSIKHLTSSLQNYKDCKKQGDWESFINQCKQRQRIPQ